MGVANIFTGPVVVWYAPAGETEPDENAVGLGDDWGGNWEHFGYTKTVTSLAHKRKDEEVKIEESLGAVKRFPVEEELTLETTLAELTADNLALGLGGTVADTAAGAAQVGMEELEGGDVLALTERAWGFEGIYTTSTGTQFPMRFFIWKGTAELNGKLDFGKAEYPGIPLQIKALEDMDRDAGERLYKFQKTLAAHT